MSITTTTASTTPTSTVPHPLAHLTHVAPRLHMVSDEVVIQPEWTMLHVVPWRDPALQLTGHDPRSDYVERFWLSVLGPSTTWLMRSIAWGFDGCPEGFPLHLKETAKALGLSNRIGKSAPFSKAVARACQFDMAALHDQHPSGAVVLRVRTHVPWLSRRLCASLPPSLRADHGEWVKASAQTQSQLRAHAVGNYTLDAS